MAESVNDLTLNWLGLDLESCDLVRWLVKANTVVLAGMPVVEVKVNGASLVVRSKTDFFLHTLRKDEGSILRSQETIATFSQIKKPTSDSSTLAKPSLEKESSNLCVNDELREGVQNLINVLQSAYSFQSSDVLERIVAHEKQRIEDEQGMWRIGGAVLGLALGVGDGFNLMDVGTSFAFSNIASVAHNQVSKEQRDFLRKIHSLWLVDQRSPFELRRRLGDPVGRFIGYDQSIGEALGSSDITDNFFIANVHQNNSRGLTLQMLGFASDCALGFQEETSKQKLLEVCDHEEVEAIGYQLYPIENASIQLRMMRVVSIEEARTKDPMHEYLCNAGTPHRVVGKDGDECILYKVSIPSHSDF